MRSLLVVLLTVGLPDGGAAISPAPLPAPPPTPAPEPAALDRLNGFQKSTWGMNEAEIRSLFPGEPLSSKGEKKMLVFTKTKVAGFEARIGFRFDDTGRGLRSVIVSFTPLGRAIREVCTSLRDGLREKYGEPNREEETPGGVDAYWIGEKTLISISCNQLAIAPRPTVTLNYFSKAAAEQDIQQKPKTDDL
jgi:hypothetical protein